MAHQLSRNNVKLHFSDLPALFSDKLKKFFSGQYQHNEDVATYLENTDKKFQIITQKLAATERELSRLKQDIAQLKQNQPTSGG